MIKRNRIAEGASSIVSVYEMDDNLLKNGNFKVKIFHQANEEWLDFVVSNRQENQIHTFDIVMGVVANDTLYKILSLYETGVLTKLETINRLKVHKLFDQISFHSNNILKEIKFVRSYEIE